MERYKEEIYGLTRDRCMRCGARTHRIHKYERPRRPELPSGYGKFRRTTNRHNRICKNCGFRYSIAQGCC